MKRLKMKRLILKYDPNVVIIVPDENIKELDGIPLTWQVKIPIDSFAEQQIFCSSEKWAMDSIEPKAEECIIDDFFRTVKDLVKMRKEFLKMKDNGK